MLQTQSSSVPTLFDRTFASPGPIPRRALRGPSRLRHPRRRPRPGSRHSALPHPAAAVGWPTPRARRPPGATNRSPRCSRGRDRPGEARQPGRKCSRFPVTTVRPGVSGRRPPGRRRRPRPAGPTAATAGRSRAPGTAGSPGRRHVESARSRASDGPGPRGTPSRSGRPHRAGVAGEQDVDQEEKAKRGAGTRTWCRCPHSGTSPYRRALCLEGSPRSLLARSMSAGVSQAPRRPGPDGPNGLAGAGEHDLLDVLQQGGVACRDAGRPGHPVLRDHRRRPPGRGPPRPSPGFAAKKFDATVFMHNIYMIYRCASSTPPVWTCPPFWSIVRSRGDSGAMRITIGAALLATGLAGAAPGVRTRICAAGGWTSPRGCHNVREKGLGPRRRGGSSSRWRSSPRTPNFNMGGIVAQYPTRVPFHYPSPHLPPGCDLFGDVLREAHARKIRVVGRFDLSKTQKAVLRSRSGSSGGRAASRPSTTGSTPPASTAATTARARCSPAHRRGPRALRGGRALLQHVREPVE